MYSLNLGMVDYLNCFPLLNPLQKQTKIFGKVYKGAPAVLNKKFLEGGLDITPISSIEYARNAKDCFILPDVSIAANGKVLSILLVSKYKVEDLNHKKIALTSSSATSVVLLKILLKFHYKIEAEFITMLPQLSTMLNEADAALLIGDDALRDGLNYQDGYVYDLGEAWKEMTGYPMVYALWVMKKKFAVKYPLEVQEVALAMQNAKSWALSNKEILLNEGREVYDFSSELLDTYFDTIKYDFDEYYQQALLTYYSFAEKAGLLSEVPKLEIWGTENATQYNIR